jgi:hypothetical protein
MGLRLGHFKMPAFAMETAKTLNLPSGHFENSQSSLNIYS